MKVATPLEDDYSSCKRLLMKVVTPHEGGYSS